MSASCDISKMIRSLGEARKRAEAAAERAVGKFANHVIGEAQQLAPQSPSQQYIGGVRKAKIKNPGWTGTSGALRDSATVEPVENHGTVITCVIGFNTVYAAAQHERMDYVHTNGQAKYLETALRANQVRFFEFVKREMDKAL